MGTALDPGVIQAALLQVADATKAAVQAGQSAAGGQGSSAVSKPLPSVDWSKLLNKPNVFDNKTAEEDM